MLKNGVHLRVIGDLGPQLFNTSMDPLALRDRVIDDIRTQLSAEAGISRDDRERLIAELQIALAAAGWSPPAIVHAT